MEEPTIWREMFVYIVKTLTFDSQNLISWQIFLRFLLKEIHARLLESFFFRTCIWEVEDFCKYLHLLTTRIRRNILYRTVQCRSGTFRAHLCAEMLCRNVSANRAKHIVMVKITCFPFSFCSFKPNYVGFQYIWLSSTFWLFQLPDADVTKEKYRNKCSTLFQFLSVIDLSTSYRIGMAGRGIDWIASSLFFSKR